MSIKNFTDACAYLVRYLVRSAYSMPANSVRPSDQPYPTGVEGGEFATVKIISQDADFGSWALEYTAGTTTSVTQNLDNLYTFVASIQFFRHAAPSQGAQTIDGAGLSPFGLGAFDKAARIGAMLSTEPMLQLMETMGLGLNTDGIDRARNVSALIDGAVWDDRGSVDVEFVIVNRESVSVATMALMSGSLKFAGSSGLITQPIGVTSP
jgi:hypothetical protein